MPLYYVPLISVVEATSGKEALETAKALLNTLKDERFKEAVLPINCAVSKASDAFRWTSQVLTKYKYGEVMIISEYSADK